MAEFSRGPRLPYAYDRPQPPKSVSDVPRYLKELLSGFFSRFGYVIKLVWNTGKWIPFVLFLVAIFKGVTPVIGSVISKNVLNELQNVIQKGGLPESEFFSSGIIPLLVALFAYGLVLQIVNTVSRSVNRIAGEQVVREVKKQIMEKSKELDIASFDNPILYEKMENANREAGNRPVMILTETFGAISSVIELISFLVILITAPGLTWITFLVLLVSIPSAIVNFIYRRKNFQYMRHRSKERRQMNYFSDLLVNKDLIKEVRLYNLADTFIQRFLAVFKRYYTGLRRLIIHEGLWHLLFAALTGIINLIFYFVLAKQVFVGNIKIGDYTLYTGALTAIASCVSLLITSSGVIYEGTLFIDNLIVFMKEKRSVVPSVSPALTVKRESTKHTIEFVNVSFRYPGCERYVLQNISFTINPGETVTLVGLNGAGKTTLIKLLTRLYDPTEGEILLDGKNLKEYDVKSLYETFGIIFQDFGKYAVSVEENIRFGDINKKKTTEQMEFAAKQSTAADFIKNLPDGYNTPLMRIFEANGLELSIGQWQKLAIARAFYADSDIIILDEPTASLDPMAEQEIFNQFDQLRNEKTTIFVSHRLSSATIADRILVLENGCLVEQGNHQELLALQGKYSTLFNTQAKRYLEQQNKE